MSEKGSFKGDR